MGEGSGGFRLGKLEGLSGEFAKVGIVDMENKGFCKCESKSTKVI